MYQQAPLQVPKPRMMTLSLSEMATDRAVIERWAAAQISQWSGREFDSERDLFPLLAAIGEAWLFDSDDRRLVYRSPNPRQLWRENLSLALRQLVKVGAITPIGNRGGSSYAVN